MQKNSIFNFGGYETSKTIGGLQLTGQDEYLVDVGSNRTTVINAKYVQIRIENLTIKFLNKIPYACFDLENRSDLDLVWVKKA